MHYLGREYMYYGNWDQAIETLHRHLALPKATWKDERCASMRYIAYSYFHKNYLDEAIMWYKKACLEAPYLREPYFDLGYLYFSIKDYIEAEKYLNKALKIKDKTISYINEEKAWNETIYDILSVVNYYNGHYKKALSNVKKAVKINSNNKRINDNYKIMLNYVEKNNLL